VDKSWFSSQSHSSAVWLDLLLVLHPSQRQRWGLLSVTQLPLRAAPNTMGGTREKNPTPNGGAAPEGKRSFVFAQFCSFNPSSVPPTDQRLQKKAREAVLCKNNSDFLVLLASQQCVCEKELPKITLLRSRSVIPSVSLLLPGKSHHYVPSPSATPLRAFADAHDDSMF